MNVTASTMAATWTTDHRRKTNATTRTVSVLLRSTAGTVNPYALGTCRSVEDLLTNTLHAVKGPVNPCHSLRPPHEAHPPQDLSIARRRRSSAAYAPPGSEMKINQGPYNPLRTRPNPTSCTDSHCILTNPVCHSTPSKPHAHRTSAERKGMLHAAVRGTPA